MLQRLLRKEVHRFLYQGFSDYFRIIYFGYTGSPSLGPCGAKFPDLHIPASRTCSAFDSVRQHKLSKIVRLYLHFFEPIVQFHNQEQRTNNPSRELLKVPWNNKQSLDRYSNQDFFGSRITSMDVRTVSRTISPFCLRVRHIQNPRLMNDSTKLLKTPPRGFQFSNFSDFPV